MTAVDKEIFSIQPPAEWIVPSEVDLAQATRHPNSPFFYLLVDYQDHVQNSEIRNYRRTIQKINDSSRIEDASLYLTELHECDQHVVFHGIDIIRDGERIPALDAEAIKVYHRETSLEQHITDNQLTVSFSIDDLRVGDLIDYHCTIIQYASEHPLWGKFYYSTFMLDWACPVLLQKIRILNQSDSELNLHHHYMNDGRGSDSLDVLPAGGIFDRQYTDLIPKAIDNTAPNWVWTDFLQVNTRTEWQQISRYLYDYYHAAGTLGGDIAVADIDRIELVGDQRQDSLSLIRFVQNQIRYRGENHGVYTHTPKPPERTLKKSAGDCKDKSNLLVALLDSIGVEANLALVNTRQGKGIDQLQPSAYHFDHMIVRVCFGDDHYYFDATIQKQAGDFEHAAMLDYGYVLNLTAAGENLFRLPFDFSRKVFDLKHCFDFSDASSGNGSLTIYRKYYLHRADNMRFYFDANEDKKMQRDFLQWAIDETELDLTAVKAIAVIEDDIEANILVTEEQYQISNLDKTHANKNVQLLTDFYKEFPVPPSKRFPIQLTADGITEHNLEIGYRHRPDIQAISESFSNSYFSYQDRVWLDGKQLCFSTRVTPHRDVVERDDIDQYLSDAERMANRCTNIFPSNASYESSLGWQLLIGAVLLAAVIAGLLN